MAEKMKQPQLSQRSTLKPALIDGIVTLFVLAIVYFICMHLWLNQGLSWHVEAAKRMLAGGSYLTNLFDDSTPATFAVFIPVVWLHQWLGGQWPSLILSYVLFIQALSLIFCYLILSKHYSSFYYWRGIYYATLVLLILPAILIFGQRENIVIALLWPYLYLIVSDRNAQTKKIVSHLWKLGHIVIGGLAAIAIMQLPLFLIIIMLIDICVLLVKKRYHASIAQASFYVFVILFAILSYVKYPAYFTVIMPLIYCFESGYDFSLFAVLSSNISLYVIAMLIFIAIFLRTQKNRSFPIISFYVVSWFFWLTYLVQGKAWYYHAYPSTALSLMTAILALCIKKQAPSEPIKARDKVINSTVLFLAYLFTAFISIMIIRDTFGVYLDFKNKQSPMNQLVQFTKNTLKNNTVLTFSTQLVPTYPLIHYTNIKLVTPWANCWLIPKWVNETNPSTSICRFNEGKKLFYQQVYQVLTKNKPRYIMFDSRTYVPYITQKNFSFITLLKKDPRLSNLLNHYRYFNRVSGFTVLKRK